MPPRKFRRKVTRRFNRYSRAVGRHTGVVRGVVGLARDVYNLKKLVNTEYKYIDTGDSGSFSTTPTVTLLNGCAQGTTAITRNGQSIRITSLNFNFYSTIHASAATSTMARILVVLDSQPNGAAMTAQQLLVTANTVSPMLLGNARRFRVLMDKRFALSINGTEIFQSHKYFKMDVHTTFNTGSAGTIADIQTNSLYLIQISDQATNVPQMTWTARVRFIDN